MARLLGYSHDEQPEQSLDPRAVAVSRYGWLTTYYGWLAG